MSHQKTGYTDVCGLLMSLSTEVDLIIFLYLMVLRCCVLHLIRCCLLKSFLKTVFLRLR